MTTSASAGATPLAASRRWRAAKPAGVCSPVQGGVGLPADVRHAAAKLSAATSIPTDNRYAALVSDSAPLPMLEHAATVSRDGPGLRSRCVVTATRYGPGSDRPALAGAHLLCAVVAAASTATSGPSLIYEPEQGLEAAGACGDLPQPPECTYAGVGLYLLYSHGRIEPR